MSNRRLRDQTERNPKEEAPRITTTRSSDESRGSSEVSDKENLGEKSIGDKNDRKLGAFGKDKKKVFHLAGLLDAVLVDFRFHALRGLQTYFSFLVWCGSHHC